MRYFEEAKQIPVNMTHFNIVRELWSNQAAGRRREGGAVGFRSFWMLPYLNWFPYGCLRGEEPQFLLRGRSAWYPLALLSLFARGGMITPANQHMHCTRR